ncbi:hypothetical protein F5Y10DRAFT_240194 [Nemania abortiva]|nr:hypothetical protein F5Y10DRAFT_240194 [Nemania abortiva]
MKFSILFATLLAGAVTAAPSIFVDCANEADLASAQATGLRCKTNPSDDSANANTDSATNSADTSTDDSNGLPLLPAGQGDADTNDIISQLQSTFDRNNPNGTPAAPGDPDDLNGDGVINVFEAGAQAA